MPQAWTLHLQAGSWFWVTRAGTLCAAPTKDPKTETYGMTHIAPSPRLPQSSGAQDTGWLILRDVTRRFDGRAALSNVSCTVGRGEVLCLVGASGCGKSTLLRLIAGVDRPDAGEVFLAGEALVSAGRFVEPENRGIGFMVQDYALFPHKSVTGNIMFGLSHLPRSERSARASAMIERMRIAHLADSYPHMLSGGEQQRVALARALAPTPRVILMDEPFSNLDRSLRDEIRAETLALIRETGTTAVLVTHDPEEALSVGDTVALMRAGDIVQMGSGRDLYDRPTTPYAATFFGHCNMIDAVCKDDMAPTPLGSFPVPGAADGDAVTVYIRPHLIKIATCSDDAPFEVIGTAFSGAALDVTVRHRDLPQPLQTRLAGGTALNRGDRIALEVSEPPCALIFARSTA